MSCDHPLTLVQKTKVWNPVEEIWEDSVRVPCGKCLPCKRKRVDQWSFRLIQEQKNSYTSYFVTLTYDTDYVPLTQRGKMTLVKTTEQYEKLPKQHRYENKDISAQAFIKRLRYYQSERKKTGKIDLETYKRSRLTSASLFTDLPIKYYLVGEYGSKKFRPHLHLILFNVISHEDIKSAWTFGTVHIDEVNKNTVDYTLKYICKPPGEKPKGFDGIPEFSLMSKGLGKSYINEDAKRFHSKDYNNFVVNNKNIKVPTPRYYTNNLVTKTQRERKAVYMAAEYQKREDEEKRILLKDGISLAEIKVKIAHANHEKLKRPIKDRGND